MARKPRINRPGAFYHVLLRGNNGQDVFFSNGDRSKFCLLLQEGIERFGHQIHGFCFMVNHIHLVLRASQNPLSHVMHHLSFRYTKYINRRISREGHLFQGRFKAILIEDNEYLTELIRYVHLNPVRAGLVKQPEDYFWSGHRVYMDLETLPWITQDWILAQFEMDKTAARKRYQRFIQLGIGQKSHYADFFESGLQENRILGSSDFVENVLHETHQVSKPVPTYSIEELVDLICHELGVSKDIVKSQSKVKDVLQLRAIIALFVHRAPHLTVHAFASHIGRDASSVSRLACNLERKVQKEPELSSLIAKIQDRLDALKTI